MIRYCLILLFFVSVQPAQAQTINYQNLNKEGFEGVSQLLQSMTPQQREAILKQAQASMGDLQKMTPQQQQQLLTQMQNIAKTIDFNKVDPAKIDPSKATGVAGAKKNFRTYEQKYQKGTLNNAIVLGQPNQPAQQ